MVDVLELDPAVIEAAKKFFAVPVSSRLKLIQGDGREFLLQSRRASYDLIFIDVGITLTRKLPRYNTQFLDAGAFDGYVRALRKNGTLMFNIMTTLSRQDEKYVSKQLRQFIEHFPVHLIFKVTEGELNTKVQDSIHVFSQQPISVADMRKKLELQPRNLSYSRDKYLYVLNAYMGNK